MFRGSVIKEWVSMSHESVDHSKHNKLLMEKRLSLYCACWNQRSVVLHDPVVWKKSLQKDIKAIKNEATSGVIEHFNDCIFVHLMKK